MPTIPIPGEPGGRSTNRSHWRPCCCKDETSGACPDPSPCEPCTDTGVTTGDILVDFTNFNDPYWTWLSDNSPWSLEQYGDAADGSYSCCVWSIADDRENDAFFPPRLESYRIALDMRGSTIILQIQQKDYFNPFGGGPFAPTVTQELLMYSTDTFACQALNHTFSGFQIPVEFRLNGWYGGNFLEGPYTTNESIRIYQ